MNGICIIDKPAGMTSHDVVKAIRKKFKTSKVGHLGTLDPMATGVLPICVGKATRMGQFIPSAPKVYEGEIRFGFSTDTYDKEGIPTGAEKPILATPSEIEAAVGRVTGTLNQVPPQYSAKKIGGHPSYKHARKGRAIEMAPVEVHVEKFEILSLNLPFMTFHVVCSPGTYIRSLAHDLGLLLGCGAHLSALRRTQSGEFESGHAVALDRLSGADVIPIERLLESWPRIEVSDGDEVKVVHGNPIHADTHPGFARIFNKKGQFLAVAAVENGWARPRLVLTSNTSD